ncbi:MAG: anthranilate phosphoribosyltransferase [Polyangiaceae bacterium]
MSTEFPKLFARLVKHGDANDVREGFDAILAGTWTPVQVGAFAIALRVMGETADMLAAAAESMRSAMVRVRHEFPVVLDTCGTGGDGAHTLNLSSGAALAVAACGIPVAKHGNRSATSRCGSADVFEALGVPLDVPLRGQEEVFREAGFVFLFAQAHHSALRHAAQARSELGTRTIFNALGPLANPASATHQLLGVYDDDLRNVAARALGRLGIHRAWVVRGEDGLDEVSPCGTTRVTEVTSGGGFREFVVTPEDFGIPRLAHAALAGGDPFENAKALRLILDGRDHPARDGVILNGAAALCVATGIDFRTSALRVRQAIDAGDASRTLECWRAAARRARGE